MYEINDNREIYVDRFFGAIFIPTQTLDMHKFNKDIANFKIINIALIIVLTILLGATMYNLLLHALLIAFASSFCISIGISVLLSHQLMVIYLCKKYSLKTRPIKWEDVK